MELVDVNLDNICLQMKVVCMFNKSFHMLYKLTGTAYTSFMHSFRGKNGWQLETKMPQGWRYSGEKINSRPVTNATIISIGQPILCVAIWRPTKFIWHQWFSYCVLWKKLFLVIKLFVKIVNESFFKWN